MTPQIIPFLNPATQLDKFKMHHRTDRQISLLKGWVSKGKQEFSCRRIVLYRTRWISNKRLLLKAAMLRLTLIVFIHLDEFSIFVRMSCTGSAAVLSSVSKSGYRLVWKSLNNWFFSSNFLYLMLNLLDTASSIANIECSCHLFDMNWRVFAFFFMSHCGNWMVAAELPIRT